MPSFIPRVFSCLPCFTEGPPREKLATTPDPHFREALSTPPLRERKNASSNPTNSIQPRTAKLQHIPAIPGKSIRSEPLMTEAVLPPQYGMICKPTALAALDAYYSALRGVPSIPIRKDHHAATEDSPAPEFSIRQVAKQFGSKQGEVLESHRFEAIAKGLGYEVRTIQPGSPEEFWDSVVANINEGKPLIVCFAVDRSTLLPSLEFDGVNEHGALIVNYQKDSRTVDLLHTQELFPNVDIELLFGSMQTLPEKREQEVYIRQPGGTVTWNNQPTWKYDFLDPDSAAPAQSDLVHSIVPEPGTGFKNKVFVFSPDAASTRWQPHPHQ